jgi:dipeptidyl aminopeptidase/acylaminoacyl peptidase
VQAVVAFVAPTDLGIMVWENPDHLPVYERFPALELDLEAAKKHSPLRHVSSDDPPTLLLVGAKDELVPISHSENIQKAFEEASVTSKLVVYENSGHGFSAADQPEVTKELVEWFRSHLLKN